MPEISLQKVNKTYKPGLFKKKVRGVTDLDLEVNSGEVFGLIGPNGAGKSTTIRLILGLIRPDSGSITFRDMPLTEASLLDEVGYLPENPYLYDHLTLRELLFFSGRASGRRPATIEKSCMELMERLSLSDVRNRPLRTFSKGMLQRAGICFALVHDPSVLILDEPMSGLDPVGRKMVYDLVLELKGRGKTIFFCSHILSDVERLCDRIGLMVEGRIVRYCSQEEMLAGGEAGIHLVVNPLSAAQNRALEDLGTTISSGGAETTILSFPAHNFRQVSRGLEEWGVQVLESRKERMSLEDIFMQSVEKGHE